MPYIIEQAMSLFRESDAGEALALAADLIREAQRLQTPQERRQQHELDRMIEHEADKATLVEMTDQAFRTHTPARVADQLTHLLDVQGIPRFFSPIEQTMLKGFQSFGEYLPGVAVPLVKEKMRQETANVILPAEPELLATHLRKRQSNGVAMNVNLLGEALLGEDETRVRFQMYFDLLRMPDVTCLSVKLTTLFSQVSPLARKRTIRIVADRLETLYRNANHVDDDGVTISDAAASTDEIKGKFIYLDMEEYRDLYLTADVLKETLVRDGLENISAGIALQAYVPDSYIVMRDLIEWSAARVAAGGSPLTIRLVKGANLEMEKVDASVGGFELAPYGTKHETDANYKRMLDELLQGAAAGSVRVGVASHNLFDVALAMIWTKRAFSDRPGQAEAVQFEMLEGMANHQRRAITERGEAMLLYAPACRKVDFLHAIGYLIRRLDENTGAENFLRHSFKLQPDTPDFDKLGEGFQAALRDVAQVSTEPRRTQDRRQDPVQPAAADHWAEFVNEPDTDWSLPHHSEWADSILERWHDQPAPKKRAEETNLSSESDQVNIADSIRAELPDPESVSLASVQETVRVAAASTWAKDLSITARHDVLRKVAQLARQRRGDWIGSMVADANKTVAEADPEVSEAIDFLEFYPLTMKDWDAFPTIQCEPRGVIAVITPWNFPLAIACGGIAAAIAAGNPVILKPSLQTQVPARIMCQAFWDAGVPRDALQWVTCSDEVAEQGLVTNPLIDTVILTGGTATAKRMLEVRPDLHLLAETGGKNATIVTALADRDLAIKHVLHSAFGHSGQKCSATSLLLLEGEVFDDPTFRATLADAVKSLPVGPSWDLHSRVTPLVDPPGKKLRRGLRELEKGESWLVMPEHVEGNLYHPGVKWNVQPGSFTHLNELFGPVLGVMRFGRLEEAIQIVRSTGYGLTSGLESLDDREIELWRESIPAGNLYINRPTTGAIVLRQPFGGVGLSAYGPGVKAGGPHYVLALSQVTNVKQSPDAAEQTENLADSTEHAPLERIADWVDRSRHAEQIDTPTRNRLAAAMASQEVANEQEFSREHDTFQLIGQDNIRRYRVVDDMTIRVESNDDLGDAVVAIAAAVCVGTRFTLSINPEMKRERIQLLESTADWLPGMIDPVEETPSQLAERIAASVNNRGVTRLRTLSGPATEVRRACGVAFVTIVESPVVDEGRIECLRYLNEQSISHDYHRYGNLGRRGPTHSTLNELSTH